MESGWSDKKITKHSSTLSIHIPFQSLLIEYYMGLDVRMPLQKYN